MRSRFQPDLLAGTSISVSLRRQIQTHVGDLMEKSSLLVLSKRKAGFAEKIKGLNHSK